MAKPPSKLKTPPNITPSGRAVNREGIPRETVEILNQSLGIDVSTEKPDRVLAAFGSVVSRSSSPYTSGEMLEDYRNRGFGNVADRVIVTIDEENRHRQELESIVVRAEQARLNRAQFGAMAVAGLGVVGSLLGGYFGVSPFICATVAVVAVGGPPVATIAARFIDRARTS